MIEDIEIEKPDTLPYMYLALLEYCSEISGDSIRDIDDHIAKTVGLHGISGTNFPRGDKLNG